jgi:ribose transport system permease protein
VLGVSQFVQQILTGAILLAAISCDRLLVLRRRTRLAASIATP